MVVVVVGCRGWVYSFLQTVVFDSCASYHLGKHKEDKVWKSCADGRHLPLSGSKSSSSSGNENLKDSSHDTPSDPLQR